MYGGAQLLLTGATTEGRSHSNKQQVRESRGEQQNHFSDPSMHHLNKRASISLFILFPLQLCSSFLIPCRALGNRRS